MSRTEIVSHSTRARAAHRFEVVEVVNRPKVAGMRFHFIGAGGVGMSGLARVLLEKRAIVTGSDQSATATTERLNRMGAEIHIGHDARNLPAEAQAVVISAAISESNPELQQARRKGCHVYKYAQLLGELMAHFEGIAIAGTHGKSTTSGWVAYCLKELGVDVSYIVGADISQLGSSSASGRSEYFVAEACEYDRSFLNLRPALACILNIDRDHLDCYQDAAQISDAFYQFALRTKPGGLIVANGDDPNVSELIRRLGGERIVVTFGQGPHCDFRAEDETDHDGFCHFDVLHRGSRLGSTRILLPGRHNVQNALAVVAIAVSMGVEPERILAVLDRFAGVDRRLMVKGIFAGITVMDDYAHHPTEIKASLQAIRERFKPERLWCVYQAHQYSRTLLLLDEFADSFGAADTVVVPEIYFVRDSEASRQGVNARILAERICANGTDARYISDFSGVCAFLEDQVAAGDLVVTMGAGDVWKVADEYIQRLRGHC